MMSAGGSLWHHKTKGVIAINVPLLCDYFEHYFAAFLHRWAWWVFILQAFGTDLRIVPPTSMGLDKNQFPIYYAIKLTLSSPFPLINPFPIAKPSSESSVGCPGYNLCMPPPLIKNDYLILAASIPRLN